MRVAERLKTKDLRKLSKLHRMIAQCSPPTKMNALPILEENTRKRVIKLFTLCAISHEN